MPERASDRGMLVVMVTYDSGGDVSDNIDYLRSIALDGQFDLVFVDNDSDDDTVSICGNVKEAVVDRNFLNAGFAAGANRGLRHIEGHEYFALLNPDVRISFEALKELVNIMAENPRVAACTPALEYVSGEPMGCWARSTGLMAMLVADITLGTYKRCGPLRRRYGWLDVRDLRRGMEPGYVSGACFVGRVSALDEIGSFDERFFMYYEEADWCRRATARGWRLMVAEGVRATHGLYASSSSNWRARDLYYRSRHKFVRKHYGRAGELLVRAADLVSGLMLWLPASAARAMIRSENVEHARLEGWARLRGAFSHE